MDIIFVFSTSNYTLCNKKKTHSKIYRHSNRKAPNIQINREVGIWNFEALSTYKKALHFFILCIFRCKFPI